MNKVMVALLLGTGLLVLGAGCSKEEEKKEGASAGAAESLGIAECDAYFKAIDSCKNAAAKPGLQQGAAASRTAWKAAMATPAGKETVKTSCKTAMDAIAATCK